MQLSFAEDLVEMLVRGRGQARVACLVAACFLLGGCHDKAARPAAVRPPLPPGVIPFVDRPADMSAVPAAAPTQMPTAAPARSRDCRVSQVAVAWSGSNGATGTTIDAFVVRNVSEQVCAVGRTTALVVRTNSGRSVTAKVMPEFFLPDRVVATDLRPHTAVSSALLTFNACNGYDGGAAGAVMSAGVSLVLAGAGLPMGQPDGRPVNVRCRPGVEPLGRHVGQPLAVTAGTLYALTARFQFTVAPRAGEVAWPLLRLQNPSAKPVPLSPCPSYMIGLGVFGAKGPEYNYRLNCDRFTLIQPGQSLTYQLRVPVPHLRGPAKLYWQMLPRSTDPALPAAAIPVQIA